MTAIEYLKEKGKDVYERLRWEWKYSSIFLKIFYPIWWFLERERGLDFPFYFPYQKRIVERSLAVFMEWLNNFVNLHEPERYAGETSLTLIKRLKYVGRNFHFYTNDTMSNLFYSEGLPVRDYQRLKSLYTNYYLLFLTWNSASGVFLVALNNFLFRTRKASIPMVFLASLSTFALFSINYNISYHLMDISFSQNVRRFGYGHLIHRYNSYYPRNVDFMY
jgi:hypothetical protein